MPALTPLFASAIEATSTSGTFEAIATTSPLASGVDYLVVVAANTLSPDTNNTSAEAEVVFGATRYGFARYQIGATGAPDSASGGQIATAFRVTGDGTSTVAVQLRRASGAGTIASTCHVAAIPLDSLVEGTHYWQTQAANSDTFGAPAAGAGYVGSGHQVDVTPASTGQFLVLACSELGFTSGSTTTDQARLRCRVTTDPLGTPSSNNLLDNLANGFDGPAVQFEGGAAWNLEIGQRFADVVTLSAGTDYRFEIEREVVTGASATGYRRERIFVFDLSVWPEVTVARDVTGQAGTNQTFASASAPAPSSAIDYLLLGSVAYQNNITWLRTHFDEDPSGTPVRLPSSAGFGTGLPDTGNALTDDYGVISLQWDRQSVADARAYAINCEADLGRPCRWGSRHGVFPQPNAGVATVMIAWGLETTTSPAAPPMEGATDGTSTAAGSLTGTGALDGAAASSSTASGTLEVSGGMAGASNSTSTAAATMAGEGALVGSSTSTSGASATLSDASSIFGTDVEVAVVGNSYTQNFGSVPVQLQHYLDARLPSHTVVIGPPPYLATSIGDTDGWYTGQTLGGMALYPTIDQSGGSGSTDAVDAILSAGPSAYDFVVLTSDFRRSEDLVPAEGIDWEILPGAGGSTVPLYGVILEVIRRVVDELEVGGSLAGFVVRMTQEGYNANGDANLDDFERFVRLQTLAARQLEAEGVVGHVIPDHYVWSRLTRGKVGTAGVGLEGPVPAYAGLTHANSLQPAGQNIAWLNRSQGAVPPFNRNGHQNAIATIVHVWTWGYLLWGIDPRGDTTFSAPSGLPSPLNNMLSGDGLRIYGGHNTGLGNRPYDTSPEWNPGGPPDSELDLDWSSTTQGQIQDRIVAAIDDWVAETTEFDVPDGAISGSSDSSSTAGGSLAGLAAMGAMGAGTSTAAGALVGVGALASSSTGTSTASGAMVGSAGLLGASSSTSTASGAITDGSELTGASASTSTAAGSLSGTGALEGSSSSTSTASLSLGIPGRVVGDVWVSDTTRPAHCAGDTMGVMQPWYVHPEDEGSILSERISYPYESRWVNRVRQTRLEAPVDLSDVVTVGVEYWNGSAWAAITGTGAVVSEVLAATSTREAGTYYRLTFAPGDGALEVVEADVGRSQPIARRWALTVAAGDLHLPSTGAYPRIVFPMLPS